MPHVSQVDDGFTVAAEEGNPSFLKALICRKGGFSAADTMLRENCDSFRLLRQQR